jgi:prepilin signal peptidase PulO-like enzyme (type II secretory pathway)
VAISTDSATAPTPSAAPASRARDIGFAILAAVLVTACFGRFGFGGRALVASVFAVVLVVISAIDLERRIIPNRIVLPATAVVLAAQVALFPDRALEWIVAAVGAALFFLVPLLVYPKGMGMGDVKLALFLGAGLGSAVVTALVFGLLAAFVFALALLVRDGRAARGRGFAFGPFLAFGGLVALFFG